MQIDFNGLWYQPFNQIMNIMTARHKVIAQNISNTNTPGYVRQSLDFKSEMSRVLESEWAQPGGTASLQELSAAEQPQELAISKDTQTPGRPDGNNVNLEQEMVGLAENSLLYKTMGKLTMEKIKLISFVINGRR